MMLSSARFLLFSCLLPLFDSLFQYIEYVNTIAVSTKFHFAALKQSMALLSYTITAQARHNNQTWPFVTISTFEALGQGVRTQAGVESIIFAPLVNANEYDRWGTYSSQHFHEWFQESRDIMITTGNSTLVSTDYLSSPTLPYIFDYSLTLQEMAADDSSTYLIPSNELYDGPYLPFWYVDSSMFLRRFCSRYG
jgi:hypothetical protein